jgi:lipopolysaccharide biosynthesis regulator YciM
MSVPGKGEPTKPTHNQMPAEQPPPSPSTRPAASQRKEPVRDLIPIPLLAGIFAVVMAVTWFLLADNWVTEMTRYRSIRAQKSGEWGEAIKHLQKLREAGAEENNSYVEHSPTYLSELGYSYFHLGEYEEALKWYQLAQQHRANMPADDQGNKVPPPDFRNMIGLVHYMMGNLDTAEQNLQGALETSKVDPLANFTLGQISMQRGNYIKAADYFKVVADNPSYADEVKKYYAEIEQKLFAGIP